MYKVSIASVLVIVLTFPLAGCSTPISAEQKRNNFDLCVINQPDYYPVSEERKPIFDDYGPGTGGLSGLRYRELPRLKTLVDKERDCAFHLR
jgi:hypothetical protein